MQNQITLIPLVLAAAIAPFYKMFGSNALTINLNGSFISNISQTN